MPSRDRSSRFDSISPAEIASNRSLDAKVTDVLNVIVPRRPVKKILFVVPPDGDASMFSYATGKSGRYPNYPAYGAASIATHLMRDGLQVAILNLNAELLAECGRSEDEKDFDYKSIVWERLREKLSSFAPDLIGVTCMFSQTHRSTVEVCDNISKLVPETPVVLGGVHISNSFADDNTRALLLDNLPGISLFFLYESEISFRDFLRVVNGQAGTKELSQLVFRTDEESFYIAGNKRPTEEQLDSQPAHELTPPTHLAENGKIGTFHRLVPDGTIYGTMLFNRGCRAKCTFCTVRNFNGAGVRSRSIETAIQEMKRLKEDFGVKHIMWLDDDFLYDKKKSVAFFNEIVKNDLRITWDCSNGVLAHSCTDEVIAAAAESGCIGLNIGMESGNPVILKQIHKPANVKTLLRAAEVLHRYPTVNTRLFLMIGFPGETYDMVHDTFTVAKEMNMDWSFVAPVQPLPNTPLFRQMATEGLIASADFDQVRYTLGAYGKHQKRIQRDLGPMATAFQSVFTNADGQAVPSPEELTQIWAYMNYHLNFGRLLSEKRPEKLDQAYKFISYISEVVAPNDIFAHYFMAYLYKSIFGNSDDESLTRIHALIDQEEYWKNLIVEQGLGMEELAA